MAVDPFIAAQTSPFSRHDEAVGVIMKDQPRLVLGSASPRRKALLMQIGIACDVQAVDIDESCFDGEPADIYVKRMAKEKAQAVQCLLAPPESPTFLLTSDTCVAFNNQILGKPDSFEHACEMWAMLSGKEHNVLSAVELTDLQALASETVVQVSKVRFAEISSAQMAAYWQTQEPCDKAGAYAIQGFAASWVEHIEGSFSSVMGLPLFETARLLRGAGFRVI